MAELAGLPAHQTLTLSSPFGAQNAKAATGSVYVNAYEGSPSAEPLSLISGNGTEHMVTLTGSPATIEDFKPGLSKGEQPKRRS